MIINEVVFDHVCETHLMRTGDRLPICLFAGKIGGAGLDVVQGENANFHSDWSNKPEAWQHMAACLRVEQSAGAVTV